jgi:molybdenum cofactor biosynthesis protein B
VYSISMAHPPKEHGHHDAHDRLQIRVVVVTVSDSRTLADDGGGAIIEEFLEEAGHLVERVLVKDDRDAIRGAVEAAVTKDAEVVVTTGGTGIAPRDVTYEVVAAMLEKRLDGFGEAFRRLSWDEVGARAVLSRAIAGTIGRTLVVSLPGSPKAVRLAMRDIVLPIVCHAVGLLRP